MCGPLFKAFRMWPNVQFLSTSTGQPLVLYSVSNFAAGCDVATRPRCHIKPYLHISDLRGVDDGNIFFALLGTTVCLSNCIMGWVWTYCVSISFCFVISLSRNCFGGRGIPLCFVLCSWYFFICRRRNAFEIDCLVWILFGFVIDFAHFVEFCYCI